MVLQLKCLRYHMNELSKNSKYPESCGIGIITPIFKKKQKKEKKKHDRNRKHYRGISLTNVIAKLLANFIKKINKIDRQTGNDIRSSARVSKSRSWTASSLFVQKFERC